MNLARCSRTRHLATLTSLALLVSDANGLETATQLVGPGATDASPLVERCPTFHWGATEPAVRQQLVVFALEQGPGGDAVSEEPALQVDLPGTARGFSPALGECLEPGRYVWAVLATHQASGELGVPNERTVWSSTLRFEVDSASTALAGPGNMPLASDTSASGRRDDNRPRARGENVSAGRSGTKVSTAGSAATAPAAVRGQSLDANDSHGVAGTTMAPGGAGVAAANEAGGADVFIDGAADDETNTLISQSTLDRPSAESEVFRFTNSGSGSLTLEVDGEEVATGPVVSNVDVGTGLLGGGNGDVTLQADLATLQARVSATCPAGSSIRAIDGAGAITCEVDDSGELSAGNQLVLNGDVLDVVEGPGSTLDADTIDGLEAADLAPATHAHLGASWTGFATNGFAVANTSTFNSAKGLLGEILTTGAGAFSAGVHGYNRGTGGSGIGVWGQQDGSGWGVYGITPSGSGVYGTSTSGTGVFGLASGTTGLNYGVYASSNSASGYGLFATGAGRAIRAVSSAAGAVVEVDSSYTGNLDSYGIQAEAETAGLYGKGHHGAWGESVAPPGFDGVTSGVRGTGNGASSYLAFWDDGLGTSRSYGVFGNEGDADIARAGFFLGSVDVLGTLTKAAGSFLIDHPLDPENKTLSHSFVESPDMMNIYNGNVTLDQNGEAWIELPEWFEALNRDFRYQLTGIGQFAPLYVAERVRNNRFKIAGGERGMTVSWQVTGIRQDTWANENRIPVEEDKLPGLRGRLIHPEAFGQPPERGMHFVHEAVHEAELDRAPSPPTSSQHE